MAVWMLMECHGGQHKSNKGSASIPIRDDADDAVGSCAAIRSANMGSSMNWVFWLIP